MNSWRSQAANAIENSLQSALCASEDTLTSAMRYATLNGGKRIRPLLCLAAATDLAGKDQSNDIHVLSAACAVEFVHAFSLVHDDLPCMDDDLLRRGIPSCHAKYGEAMALLAGDALVALSFKQLVNCKGKRVFSYLADATGHTGMIGGQATDITGDANTVSELRKMHAKKTGTLFQAALVLGGLQVSANNKQISKLEKLGCEFGICYQIADDIKDATGTKKSTGKNTKNDDKQGRHTYVTTLGLSRARTLMKKHKQNLIEVLDSFTDNPKTLQSICQEFLLSVH